MIYLISNTPNSKVNHLKVCDIRFFKFSVNLDEFDALVITSKNTINSLKFNSIKPSKNIQIYSIGLASSKASLEFGFDRVYTAKNSHGNEFGYEILPLLKDKKILYIKAKENVSNLSEILSFATIINGYENICLSLDKSLKPPKNSILIFTSPKNVECFVSNFGFDESYNCVSIGNSTTKILKNYTKNIKTSKFQTINSTIELALSLL
ncbi:MAG: uroporphyrinogen-III synthase [Campylobacter sp.]|nr:uroporphyrinogen-III synthase [Campylobacter sp.]